MWKWPERHGKTERKSAGVLTTIVILAQSTVGAAQTPVGPMPTAERSTVESRTAPAWLYTPSHVSLELPAGVQLELVAMRVVSSDQSQLAALIGTFRNRGRDLTGVALTLSYLHPDGQSIVRSAPNAAHVSEIPAEGILPFRFPLFPRAALPSELLAFRISVHEHVSAPRRPLPATMRKNYSFRRQGDKGVRVVGTVDVPAEAGQHESGLLITVVLMDAKGELLDVLAGRPAERSRLSEYQVEFGSLLPGGKNVTAIEVYVEAVSAVK